MSLESPYPKAIEPYDFLECVDFGPPVALEGIWTISDEDARRAWPVGNCIGY